MSALAELLALATQIDNRVGLALAGHVADRIPDVLRRAAAEHDCRVSELLAANNREVERRREVERALRSAREYIQGALNQEIRSFTNAPGAKDIAHQRLAIDPEDSGDVLELEELIASLDAVLADG